MIERAILGMVIRERDEKLGRFKNFVKEMADRRGKGRRVATERRYQRTKPLDSLSFVYRVAVSWEPTISEEWKLVTSLWANCPGHSRCPWVLDGLV